MKTTINRIEAGRLLPQADLKRLGLAPKRALRVILETLDDEDEISVTAMNVQGKAFDHLADEPELYSDDDLIERNEDFVR
ncbi:MAG: hypothetical protein EPN26_06970 [Rhodospirillales bacterium]|nr:MAG: hypothetical protein EPN26_06970 [Rhodospirillales bacterium]